MSVAAEGAREPTIPAATSGIAVTVVAGDASCCRLVSVESSMGRLRSPEPSPSSGYADVEEARSEKVPASRFGVIGPPDHGDDAGRADWSFLMLMGQV